MNLLVTGSSGCLARVLLPLLFEQDFVEHVIGIDIKPPTLLHSRFQHVDLDMRQRELRSHLHGIDAVIHLGFAITQGKYSVEEMRDINVNGSCNVVDAALEHKVPKLINLSSVSVYGSGLDLLETAARRPSDSFYYAQHKAELEQYIETKAPHATQFRAHLIIGAHAQDFLRGIFRLPVWLSFGAQSPRQQVIHEFDVATAIVLALKQNAAGIFNLAAPEVIAIGEDYIRKGIEEGRKIRRVPFSAVRLMARIGKAVVRNDFLTFIEMLDTSATVKCDKAKQQLGWVPQYSAWDARRDAINSFKSN